MSVNLLAKDRRTGKNSVWVPGNLHSVWKRCLLSVTGWTNNVSFLTSLQQKALRGCEATEKQHGCFSMRSCTFLGVTLPLPGCSARWGSLTFLAGLVRALMCKQIRYAEVVGAAAVYLMHLSYEFNSFLIAYNTAHCNVTSLLTLAFCLHK